MLKDKPPESPYRIQVLDTVFRILDLLADRGEGATLGCGRPNYCDWQV